MWRVTDEMRKRITLVVTSIKHATNLEEFRHIFETTRGVKLPSGIHKPVIGSIVSFMGIRSEGARMP